MMKIQNSRAYRQAGKFKIQDARSGQALRQSSGQARLPTPERSNGGQAMLIIVLVLGATMLGVATIAGYVSLQKIRASSEIVDSTRAIYAADSAVDWCLYNKFGPNGTSTYNCTNANPIIFDDSANVNVNIIETNNVVRAIGHAYNSYRAFGIFLGVFNQ